MNIYIVNRSCSQSGYIRGYINALQNSLVRAKYYDETNDIRFLNESDEWVTVSNIYLKEIFKEHTSPATFAAQDQ